MASLTESISVMNSAARTLIGVVLVGGLGVGGWYGYTQYNASEIEALRTAEALTKAQGDLERTHSQLQETQTELVAANQDIQVKDEELKEKNALIVEKDAEIETLNETVQQQGEEIVRLDTSLRLLKVDHRVARISVVDQTIDPESKETTTLVQFQELDDQGTPIEEPKQFRIRGDMIYVDSWIVKFEDKYVEEADIDRSTSLVLFRRIFGEFQEPNEGFALDQEGSRPTVYGHGGKISDFEQRIWDDFWNVANDESRQGELGIRAAHGDAPSIKVQKGRVYRVELRSSDGLSITLEADPPQADKPAA
ncbi:MAG: hypothetical protein ACC628_10065 [Pirellulaceae bacterium]